ncbi:MAG: GNAT family N-acetyltransferase [Micropruina sp.]
MIMTATIEDLGRIMSLERSGFDADQQWGEATWLAELNGSDRVVLVAAAERDDLIDGVATFQVVADTADLHRVVVRPRARRTGLAKVLLAEGFGRVSGLGAERVLLEVEQDNTAARALYDRAGFAVIADRRDYYGPGRHALVLERNLGGVA